MNYPEWTWCDNCICGWLWGLSLVGLSACACEWVHALACLGQCCGLKPRPGHHEANFWQCQVLMTRIRVTGFLPVTFKAPLLCHLYGMSNTTEYAKPFKMTFQLKVRTWTRCPAVRGSWGSKYGKWFRSGTKTRLVKIWKCDISKNHSLRQWMALT